MAKLPSSHNDIIEAQRGNPHSRGWSRHLLYPVGVVFAAQGPQRGLRAALRLRTLSLLSLARLMDLTKRFLHLEKCAKRGRKQLHRDCDRLNVHSLENYSLVPNGQAGMQCQTLTNLQLLLHLLMPCATRGEAGPWLLCQPGFRSLPRSEFARQPEGFCPAVRPCMFNARLSNRQGPDKTRAINGAQWRPHSVSFRTLSNRAF